MRLTCLVLVAVLFSTISAAMAAAPEAEPMTRRGDTLYTGDKEFRIWGFSLVHGLELSDEQLAQSTAQLKFLGTNMVRLHTILQNRFSDWGGGPCGLLPMFQNDLEGTTRKFSNFPAFWRFMNAIRDKGIYYSINLVHGRVYLPGDADVLETTPEDKKAWQDAIRQMIDAGRPESGRGIIRPSDMRYLCKFDERAAALEEERARNFLNLVNPQTGKRLADDPYFAMIETVNEATGPRWIIEKNVVEEEAPYFQKKIKRQWADYLKKKYKTDAALKKAWQQKGRIGLDKGESLTNASVGIHPVVICRNPVVVEFDKYSAARSKDLLHFITDLDMKFYRRMKKVYDEEGFKGLTHNGDITLAPGGNADYLWVKSGLGDFWTEHGYPNIKYNTLRWQNIDALKTCIREGVKPHPYAWDRPYWRAEWRTIGKTRIVDPLYNAVYFSLTGIDGYTPHSWEMRYNRNWYGTTGLLANEVEQFDLNGDIPWQVVYRAAGRLFRSGEIDRLTDVEILNRFPKNGDIESRQVKRSHTKGNLIVETKNFRAVAAAKPDTYEFRDMTFKIDSDDVYVVIIEKITDPTLGYDYEISAVGASSEFTSEPIKWDNVKYVKGEIRFKEGQVETVTWMKENGKVLRVVKEPAGQESNAMRFSNHARLYRVKLKKDNAGE